VGNDERMFFLAPLFDEIDQPLLAIEQAEVKVLLLAKLDLAPLWTELAVGAAFFVSEKLFLAHAVVAALLRFVEPAALACRRVFVVPEALENLLHARLVQRIGRGGPGVVAH